MEVLQRLSNLKKEVIKDIFEKFYKINYTTHQQKQERKFNFFFTIFVNFYPNYKDEIYNKILTFINTDENKDSLKINGEFSKDCSLLVNKEYLFEKINEIRKMIINKNFQKKFQEIKDKFIKANSMNNQVFDDTLNIFHILNKNECFVNNNLLLECDFSNTDYFKPLYEKTNSSFYNLTLFDSSIHYINLYSNDLKQEKSIKYEFIPNSLIIKNEINWLPEITIDSILNENYININNHEDEKSSNQEEDISHANFNLENLNMSDIPIQKKISSNENFNSDKNRFEGKQKKLKAKFNCLENEVQNKNIGNLEISNFSTKVLQSDSLLNKNKCDFEKNCNFLNQEDKKKSEFSSTNSLKIIKSCINPKITENTSSNNIIINSGFMIKSNKDGNSIFNLSKLNDIRNSNLSIYSNRRRNTPYISDFQIE